MINPLLFPRTHRHDRWSFIFARLGVLPQTVNRLGINTKGRIQCLWTAALVARGNKEAHSNTSGKSKITSATSRWVTAWNEQTTTFQTGVPYDRMNYGSYRSSCNGYGNPWKVVSIVYEPSDVCSVRVNKKYVESLRFSPSEFNTTLHICIDWKPLTRRGMVGREERISVKKIPFGCNWSFVSEISTFKTSILWIVWKTHYL